MTPLEQSLKVLRRAAYMRNQRRKKPQPLRVILGAGNSSYSGWIDTDKDTLDITSTNDWQQAFKPASIDRLLTEHVLEHLSWEQNQRALALCYRYLKPAGVMRIAVPDGNRKDSIYVAAVAPPADGHELLFTLESLTALLVESGFVVHPLEYFDTEEVFRTNPWDSVDGHVYRSVRSDRQLAFRRDGLFYTSLIVDAIKPIS